MCFSAGASFTASALLALAGAATLSRVKRREEYMLALIPLLFAIQQFAEGVLWLTLVNERFYSLQKPALYTFLCFAYILWPIWISVSLQQFYYNSVYASRFKIPIICAIAVSLVLCVHLIVYGATASIHEHHILYHVGLSYALYIIGTIGYLIATVIPFLTAPAIRLKILGVLLAISYVISMLFYTYVATSVWCFFAALLSVFIFIVL